jgi:hypothetical protein
MRTNCSKTILRVHLYGKASSASLLITDRLRIQTDRKSEPNSEVLDTLVKYSG